jgi:hypothetical protein
MNIPCRIFKIPNKTKKISYLVSEVALDVYIGHELTNRELWVKKLPRASILFIPSQPMLFADVANYFFFANCPRKRSNRVLKS